MRKQKIAISFFLVGAILFLAGLFPDQKPYIRYILQNVLGIITGGGLMITGLIYGSRKDND